MLHRAKYAHCKYGLWDDQHDANCTKYKYAHKAETSEGGNDFIIVGPYYIFLTEVENFIDDVNHLKEL